VNLMAAGAIIAAGTASSINADTISLNAVGSGIGTDATSRLTVNALQSLTLTTSGGGNTGDIYIAASQLPVATLMARTNNGAIGAAQTIDIDVDLVAAATLPTVIDLGLPTTAGAGTDTIILDISSTGNLTVDSSVDLRLVAAVSTIDLTSTAGAVMIGTSPVSPANPIVILGADTVNITAAMGVNGSGAVNAGSVVAMSDTGSITGVGFVADSISLSAVGIGTAAVGAGAIGRVLVDAAETLSLTTTGATSAGDIYIVSAVAPSEAFSITTPADRQTVDYELRQETGDITLPAGLTLNLDGDDARILISAVSGAIIVPAVVDLTASASSRLDLLAQTTISVSAALLADTIELTTQTGNIALLGDDTDGGDLGNASSELITINAGGNLIGARTLSGITVGVTAANIGTSASPVIINASDSLTLTSTGSGSAGDIYVAAAIVPLSTLSVGTAATAQTVDLNFTVPTGAVSLPLAVTLAQTQSDTVVFSFTATAGEISVPSPVDLAATASSTLNLTADSNITSSAALTATDINVTSTSGTFSGTGDITASSTLNLTAGGNITSSAALTATDINVTSTSGIFSGVGDVVATTAVIAAAGLGTDVNNRLTLNIGESLTLTTTGVGAGGNIFIDGTGLPSDELAIATATSAQTVDAVFTIADGNVTLTTTNTFVAAEASAANDLAGDTVNLSIEAQAGDIFVDSALILPRATGALLSTLNLTASGAVTTTNAAETLINAPRSSELSADTINIIAVRVGPNSDAVIGDNSQEGVVIGDLAGDRALARLAANANTLNIVDGTGTVTADHIYLALSGNLVAGNLVTSGRLSINPNSIDGADRFSVGGLANAADPVQSPAGTDGLSADEVNTLIEDNIDSLVSFQATRLYIGAATDVPIDGNIAVPITQTNIDTAAILQSSERQDGSVSLRYITPDGTPDGEDVLRLEYVNSVRDFILSSDSDDSRLIIGEIGIFGTDISASTTPNFDINIEDTVLHNFASIVNGYAVFQGSTLLSAGDTTQADISRYTNVIGQPAFANFNAERFYLYTSAELPAVNFIGSSNAPLILDRRAESVLRRISGVSGTFFFGGAQGTFRYGSIESRAAGSVARLRGTGVLVDLSGEVGQVSVVTTVSSFRASEDFTLFVDTSVFLTFDLVVYSDEANATCTSYTFEEREEEDNEVDGCV
ncbi:MAG: hypothetical protein K0U66_00470, partial [Gammaproteobacteria bacterium]|nr:hypothetical protein [Gammaproteobacteria bacterium]